GTGKQEKHHQSPKTVPSPNSVPYNHSQTKVNSTSIPPRIRRNRERLPSCLLIENVSAIVFAAPPDIFAPRHFRSRLATIRKLSRFGINTRGFSSFLPRSPGLSPGDRVLTSSFQHPSFEELWRRARWLEAEVPLILQAKYPHGSTRLNKRGFQVVDSKDAVWGRSPDPEPRTTPILERAELWE